MVFSPIALGTAAAATATAVPTCLLSSLSAVAAVPESATPEAGPYRPIYTPARFHAFLVVRGGSSGASAMAPSHEQPDSTTSIQASVAVADVVDDRAAVAESDRRSSTMALLVEQWWYGHIPSLMRYFVSGNLGNVCFYLCERLVSNAVDDHYHVLPALAQQLLFELSLRDSVSFVTAYMLHIPAQHYLHALLVYGLESINTSQKYWQTLGGTYSALTTSCLGSTALNHALLVWWGSQYKTLAFIATLWTFAVVNFFVLGWIVRRTAAKMALAEAEAKAKADKAVATASSATTATAESSNNGQHGANQVTAATNQSTNDPSLVSNPLLDSNEAEVGDQGLSL